ncbi:hypothetical protein MTR_5g020310 [Medicago truncatula]|uniref:Uncharacterized protein n=1 Tax=Medicago truncatula TaxID=3880 RepID=G7KDL8_MEDTR|nr:hypothetical protein MTR_5g020310 [Medicago truncatula]
MCWFSWVRVRGFSLVLQICKLRINWAMFPEVGRLLSGQQSSTSSRLLYDGLPCILGSACSSTLRPSNMPCIWGVNHAIDGVATPKKDKSFRQILHTEHRRLRAWYIASLCPKVSYRNINKIPLENHW